MSAKLITEYDEFTAKLSEIEQTCNFIPDTSTQDGYDKSKRVSIDVGKVLSRLEDARKSKKKYHLDAGRAVDAEAKQIKAQIEAYQLPHKSAYKQIDDDKKRRETERKDKLERRINDITELPFNMRDSDSEGIKAALEDLAANECLDYYEYTQQALLAKNKAAGELTDMFGRTLENEKNATELAQLKASNEQAEKDAAVAKGVSDELQRAEAARQIERAAENRRAENTEHRRTVNNAAVTAIIELGVNEDTAKILVTAIAKNSIPNITISY